MSLSTSHCFSGLCQKQRSSNVTRRRRRRRLCTAIGLPHGSPRGVPGGQPSCCHVIMGIQKPLGEVYNAPRGYRNPMEVPSESRRSPIGVPWETHRRSRISWKHHWSTMGASAKSYRGAAIPWTSHGSSIGSSMGVSWEPHQGTRISRQQHGSTIEVPWRY